MTIWWWIYAAALGTLGIYAGHRLSLIALCRRTRGREVQVRAPGELPRVTVQLPLYNERLVARRLLASVAALDWPRDRLQIQVLDDSTDDTADFCRAECARLVELGRDVEYHHRSDRTGFKAGALEAGLATATGELILILDADFVPEPDLLRRVAGCFTDPEVGMVQVRWEHINRSFSLLTEIQALLLDGHFVVEQPARARSGRFFNFNGTAGVWRRAAIEDAGGWHHDTLTEDLDLSYRALLAGWRFRYLAGTAVPAELPVQMAGFKSQQFRWAKGSVQVARKLLPLLLRARVPRRVKLEGFFHLTQNVPYLLTAILAISAVPALAVGDRSAWPLELALMLGTVGTLAAYCATSQRRVLPALARIPALIAVTAGISINQSRAVIEGAIGHDSPFVRTPKHGVTRRGERPRRYRSAVGLIPVAELALAVYFAGGVAAAIAFDRPLAIPALAIFAAGFAYVGLLSLRR